VVPDNRFNGYLATEHLIRMGHRRIAHITGPEGWEATRERAGGYREALKAHGLEADPELVVPGDWLLPTGYRGGQALMGLDDPPTAVFASSDRMALGAIYSFQDAGVRVPEDVAVVGYDDRDFAQLVRPALTTVRMPGYEMGARAAQLLLDRIRGDLGRGCEVPVPGELIVRASCGKGRERAEPVSH
jgi:DNA-binding LacI/PurR family transcriptional regulator